MARITALVFVLTLTGDPVVNALCVNWCDTPSRTHSCSEAIAQSLPPELSLAVGTCAALLTLPLLKEEGRAASGVAAPLDVVKAVALSTGDARLTCVRGRGDATAGRPQPVLVLRV